MKILLTEPVILLAGLTALSLAAAAQIVLRLTMRQTLSAPARISGFATARRLLDGAGLEDVAIEQVPGLFSDHYDPTHRVVRLSGTVYHGRSLAAVGTAAHEVGHALQQASGDIRVWMLGWAGIAASFGSGAGIVLSLLGLGFPPLLSLGACIFSVAVLIQVLNLPTEFNAGRRGWRRLRDSDLVAPEDSRTIAWVIRASAFTYLAATLQTVVSTGLTIFRYVGRRA